MSQKYRRYVEQQKRDQELCAACQHPRVWHLGEGPCSLGQVRTCDCRKFVEGKKGGSDDRPQTK